MLRYVGPDHIWRQLRLSERPSRRRPVLFLDRDGVVVEEVDYLHRVSDVRFIDAVVRTIAAARERGWCVALVTNQAGIGRGYYSWEHFAAVNEHILTWLDARGARVDAVLATPHHPHAIGNFRVASHPMRKPNPGMILAGAAMLNGELDQSIIVGDNVSDLSAGRRAGLRGGFHVLTGHGERYRLESLALCGPSFEVSVISHAGDPLLRRTFECQGTQ